MTHFSCPRNAEDENDSTHFIGWDKNENEPTSIKRARCVVSVTEVSAVIRWGWAGSGVRGGTVPPACSELWGRTSMGPALTNQAESERLSSCLQGSLQYSLLLKTWTWSQREPDSNLISSHLCDLGQMICPFGTSLFLSVKWA